MLNVGFLLLTFHVLVLVKTCEQRSHVHVVKKTSNLNSLLGRVRGCVYDAGGGGQT